MNDERFTAATQLERQINKSKQHAFTLYYNIIFTLQQIVV